LGRRWRSTSRGGDEWWSAKTFAGNRILRGV